VALFVGEFDQVVDAKHRLAIPAALRDQINPAEDGESFYLMLGPDRHLWLYPDLAYRRMLEPLRKNPLPTRGRQRWDMLFALARVVQPDSQGRVVLPEKSMQRALLDAAVTLVGTGDHIEIWPTSEWEKHVDENLPRYGEDVLNAGDGLDQAGQVQK
jgi:MraZ protein